MKIELYDRVYLKSGVSASIVAIYEPGVAYEADIDYPDVTETDPIKQEEILEKL